MAEFGPVEQLVRRIAENMMSIQIECEECGGLCETTPDGLVCIEGREVEALRNENARMRAALMRIEKWSGEFPPTGHYWDEPNNKEPMSYSACYGSNGERDYMRNVARQALTPNAGGNATPREANEGTTAPNGGRR